MHIPTNEAPHRDVREAVSLGVTEVGKSLAKILYDSLLQSVQVPLKLESVVGGLFKSWKTFGRVSGPVTASTLVRVSFIHKLSPLSAVY